MRILIDGDAFPDLKAVSSLAKKYQVPVIVYMDYHHEIEDDYVRLQLVDTGKNSADLAIENEVQKSDLILTQDYGVAVIGLSKKAHVLHPNGFLYREDNLNQLLEQKQLHAILRKQRKHIKGPKKRTLQDTSNLLEAIENIIKIAEAET